jgi:hypothetical protein
MNPVENRSRPKLLTWLCIGSATFGSLWIIMLLALIVFSASGNIPAGLFPGLAVGYMQAGYSFMIAMILLALLGLTGVYLMWHLNSAGFYLYSSVKAAIYYLPVIVLGNNNLTFVGLFITSALIILYGLQFMSHRKKI